MIVYLDRKNGEPYFYHTCDGLEKLKADGHGNAINSQIEYHKHDDIGMAWCLGNGEYGSYPIYYCPCCGVKLDNPTVKKEVNNESN